MKTDSTVYEMMRQLFRISQEEENREIARESYNYATALQWVAQTTNRTPASLVRDSQRLKHEHV